MTSPGVLDLGDVALALSATQSVEDVLDVLAQVALPLTGAQGLTLSLVRGHDLVLLRHAGYSDEVVALLASARLDDPTPTARTAFTAQPVFLETVSAYDAQFPASVANRVASEKQAWAFLPLVASDRVLGTLLVSWTTPRVFGTADRADLLALAGLASQSMERARLLDAAQGVSAALQQALLPAELPQVAGLTFAARYRPSLQLDQVVGGDWYDAHETPNRVLSISIGDVVGHDIQAAAVMGEVRHTVRAFASEGYGPSGVLQRVNRLLANGGSGTGEGRLATCLYLHLDPLSGIGTAVSAGHPAPVLMRRGEPPRLLEVATSLPLGVLADAGMAESSGAFLPGDVLLLYTDGLVEGRTRPVGDGIALLLEHLAGLVAEGGVGDLERLADDVLATCDPESTDDCALLLAAWDPVDPPRREVVRRFADEAVSVPLARSYAADVADAWGLAAVLDELALVVTELVTNAVAHTVGFCELGLRLAPGVLRVSVTDNSDRLPAELREVPEDAEGGRGMLIVELLAEQWGIDVHGTGKTVWAELAL